MSAFTLTRGARAGLKAIARFTEKRWGRVQRNIYLQQFDDTFHMLAEAPATGTKCDEIKTGYRRFPQGSHIIFYTVGDDRVVQIIRILHNSMDAASKLGRP